MALIELENVTKVYRSGNTAYPALRSVDLSIRAGEFAAIMGASGSGKTTLLNLIGCMDLPTSGIYRFDGVDMSRAGENQLAQIRGRRIAFVFQNFALLDRYTVRENMEVPLLRQALPRAERKTRAMAALTAVGIAGLAQKRPGELSGGQKQRAAIARAIACGAEVLLADEPTGALDSQTGKEIMDLFARFHARGGTVVLITHDRQVAACAKRQITIQDGRIVQDEMV